jgi:flavin-dependent dehydrogenase
MHHSQTSSPHAVIGASASGLYTALLLARSGEEVTIHERRNEVDPQERTLIVTGAMRDMLGDVAEKSIVNEIRQFELYADGKVATVPLGRPDLIIERSALIRSLAKEAETAGVQIRSGRRFKGIEPAGDGMAIRFAAAGNETETVYSKTLVGADGTYSDVATSAGWSQQPTVSLLQAVVKLPVDLPPSTSRVWFRPEDTPYFYWLIPESESLGALGVIAEDATTIRPRLERFLEDKGLEPLEFQAARIPCYRRWRPVHKRVGGGDVYLVGDAAGQVKVTTVGGIVTGFRGAQAVAEQILGHSHKKTLRGLRRELEIHRVIRKIMHPFGEDQYRQMVVLINDATRKSLVRHDRDRAVNMMWRVAIGQPGFVWLSLRSLLSRS